MPGFARAKTLHVLQTVAGLRHFIRHAHLPDCFRENPVTGRRFFLSLPRIPRHAGLAFARPANPPAPVYGMINMLKKLEDISFDYSAVVFDKKGKTFRDELYPEYKAQRPPMPPELAAQITPVHAAVTGLGWPLLMVEGVETDDVIGALAHQASARKAGGWWCPLATRTWPSWSTPRLPWSTP